MIQETTLSNRIPGMDPLTGPSWELLRQRRRLILVAEDDPDLRELLGVVLTGDGYDAVGVPDGMAALSFLDEALEAESRDLPALLITDVRMPRCQGIDLVAFATRLCRVPAIVISAFGDEETFAEAEALGASCCFDKPFDLDELRAVVRRLARPS